MFELHECFLIKIAVYSPIYLEVVLLVFCSNTVWSVRITIASLRVWLINDYVDSA